MTRGITASAQRCFGAADAMGRAARPRERESRRLIPGLRRPAEAAFPRPVRGFPRRPRLAATGLLALAAAFALLLSAGAAQAQTSVTLVSNTGQATSNDPGTHFNDQAQHFTTGSHTSGYTLTEVQVDLTISGASLPSYEVEIWTAQGPGTGQLGTKIATLTKPATLATGLNSFTSTSGVKLDPSTSYFVLFDLSSAGASWQIETTASGAEDDGKATGWQIHNWGRYRNRGNTGNALTPHNNMPRKISIIGYANPLRFKSGVGPLRLEPDAEMTPVVLPEAEGGNGAYTYTLTSQPAGLAGLTFDLAERTLSGTPEAEGRWTFTWTVTDANGDTARLPFRVTVGAVFEEQQQVVKRALAEVASRTVSGALNNIGTRLGDAAPGLTLAGERVRFGASGTAGAMERWAGACPPDAHARSRDHAFEPGAPGCALHAGSRGMTPDALLGATAFSWTLGAAPGNKEAGNKEGETGLDPDAPRWAVWGRGDFGSFSGRPDDISRYDGSTRTGWLGVDAREAPRGSGSGSERPGRWVAGLAVSRGTSETDYVMDGEPGRIETALTALWPYGRWTFANGLELRGMLGAGRGEARHTAGDGSDGEPAEKSDLTMWAGSAGLRRPLPPMAGIELAVQGDMSLARMRTAKGGEEEEQAVDGIRADAWRLRGGIEASRRFALKDSAGLTPFAEAAARRDGGDGVTGTGIEVAGGVRVTAPGLQVEARGRWLAAHSKDGAEERGVSLTARAGPGAHGRGLSVVLNPRWGAPAGGTSGGSGALWREELPRGAASGAREAGALDGELGYGIGLFGGRLTGTPNVGFGASDGGGRDYRLGWRLTPAAPGYAGFRVDLDATRRESANRTEPPAHGAMLKGAIRW